MAKQISRWFFALATAGVLLSFGTLTFAQNKLSGAPEVGDRAKDFELDAVAGSLKGKVKLSDSLKKGPVVLVVLRGYPGYQ